MLYEKFEKAWEDADVDLYKSLHHDDWEFKFHSSGHVMKSGDVYKRQRIYNTHTPPMDPACTPQTVRCWTLLGRVS